MTTEQIATETELEFAGRIRMQAEKMRIACANHAKQKPDSLLAQAVMNSVQATEDLIEKDMQSWMRNHKVWKDWGLYVRDLGPMGLSALMSRCDIHRLTTIGKMWAHCGFAPGQKRVKGEKLTFDMTAKVLAYRVGLRFIQTAKPGAFNLEYYSRKEYETAHVEAAGGRVLPATKGKPVVRPNMALGEVDSRARRYMTKIFLACLWIVWREAEGLEVRPPYSAQYPGSDGAIHHGYDPYKFVENWPGSGS